MALMVPEYNNIMQDPTTIQVFSFNLGGGGGGGGL
jgi:hypothetical protein